MHLFFTRLSQKFPMANTACHYLYQALFITGFLMYSIASYAQGDSTIQNLQQMPFKYISVIDNKVDKYSKQVSSKTQKTLEKLSRWENKIQGLLEKVSPETALKLFGGSQPTFGSILAEIKKGESTLISYQSSYNKYRDDASTMLNYLAEQSKHLDDAFVKKARTTQSKLRQLSKDEDEREALEQFIRERKKELITQSLQHIGRSKYLKKINKEAYYYAETIKNYKEVLSNPKKAEVLVKGILNKIPAFEKFMKKNSILSSLFRMSEDNQLQDIPGLQTRSFVQALIQDRVAAGGADAQQIIQQNISQAKSEMDKIKNKITELGGGSSDMDMPGFKPNSQKAKSFKQRIEVGANFQFGKSTHYFPTTADIGFSIGYKLNDRSITGVGLSYKMGMGNPRQIRISNQGASVRSFIDWKLKKQFFISGGWEMNYLAGLAVNEVVPRQKDRNKWQHSALIGISKKIGIKSKWFKENKLQLLYDFLSSHHVPVSQALQFRIGYTL